jgi:hypothetical protein
LADIQSRARSVWKVNADGQVVLLNPDGTEAYSKKEASTKMPMKEWLEELGKSAPHFLKSNTGGGATGNRDSGASFDTSSEAWQKLSPQKRLELARSQKSR